jgi:trehalose-phosphatase
MKVINPEIDIDVFFRTLSGSKNRALFLDYDGTLAPFQKQRNKAFPYPGIREVLDRMIQSGRTKVVIVSGRRLDELIPLLGLSQFPEVWGSHGGERRLTNGTYFAEPLPDATVKMVSSLKAWVEQAGWEDLLEIKPLGLAIHWRGLNPDRVEEIKQRTRARLPSNMEKDGLTIHDFDGGLELRPKGIDKGRAVKTSLQELGPDGIGAYLGDDLTDEDAFKAIKNHGIGVLVRNELRKTRADVWLRPPEELLDFLNRWTASIL